MVKVYVSDSGDEYKAKYPHCDQYVLHAPKTCEYCDHYPERQQERITQGINFTRENNPDKKPCPSQERRPLDTLEQWHGNRAYPVKE